IVIAIRGVHDFMTLLSETESLFEKHPDLAGALLWYCWTGFLEVHTMSLGPKWPLFASQLLMSKRGSEPPHPSESWRRHGLALKMLHFGEHPRVGLFARLFPVAIAGAVIEFEDRYIDTGTLQQMPDALKERLKPLTIEALTWLTALWHEY